MKVQIKRIYEPASKSDGTRILIDRIWPRGVTKDRAQIALWLKDVAPTTQLRRWFGHKPERWQEFRRRYRAELSNNPAIGELRDLTKKKRVTLLYAAHDGEHNHALVLAAYLQAPMRTGRSLKRKFGPATKTKR